MKNKNTYFSSLGLFVLIVVMHLSNISMAQENDLSNYRIRFNVRTIKNPDQSRTFEASFIAHNKKDRKDRIPAHETEILFVNSTDDEDITLGSAVTDMSGIASLVLPETQVYLTDEEGFINVEARFKGSDGLKKQRKSVAFKDLYINLELQEVDSVKMVSVKAFTLDSLQTEIPENDIDVVLSIGGMLSRMTVDEGSTEEGLYEFEFPDDIPGDKDGNFKIFAFVEDHDDFGDVLAEANSNWGVFDDIVKVEKYELWTKAAPIWMYVVLTILLVGVWANYIYTLIKLKDISKSGKKAETVV